ncbi:MAG TPA: uracil-DNA glycosylase [Gallionellaceae bacterium]|nr:uracil-DNA glycosylase [Gallionellaceae bacterium]
MSDDAIPTVDEPAYPPLGMRYRALELLEPVKVRVVILGQDPYHGAGEAHGLAFSVPNGVRMPPSLRNILREVTDDLQVTPHLETDLTRWVEQGVLLLNTALSVAPDSPGSHANIGWKPVTDAIVAALGRSDQPVAFILWGKHAQGKRSLIQEDGRHLVIESVHPSPLSAHRGFFGSKPFSRINHWLRQQGQQEIDWR